MEWWSNAFVKDAHAAGHLTILQKVCAIRRRIPR
jgi:hypothetical protein